MVESAILLVQWIAIAFLSLMLFLALFEPALPYRVSAPPSHGPETEAFLRVKSETRMTRYGGDCYAYCMLASGFVDVIVETGLKTYDVAALIPIVEKAGGRFTSWDGGPATQGGQIVASGDPALHERILKIINR